MEEFYGSGIVKEEQIQMEIRLLYGNEIQWAVQTAHEVYEQCVRPYTRTGRCAASVPCRMSDISRRCM